MYSQHGEDGYIAEIFSRIGTTNKFFVEIGVETGQECNTRFLLELGWQGIWLDANQENLQYAYTKFANYVQSGQLQIVYTYLTPDNINDVVSSYANLAKIDFVSVDTDQHTHFLWQSLKIEHRVSCIEYNASLPANLPIAVPYDPTVTWDGTNYFGASLKALEKIGATLVRQFEKMGQQGEKILALTYSIKKKDFRGLI